MSDANLAEWQSDNAPAENGDDAPTRSRAVKPGHLEVGEFTSGRIGASSPFGGAVFPLPVGDIYYEPSKPVATRILEDERH
ncbi:hypothetical protein [Glycomyces harbinensis]|uniref:Uncharacterized protein n=1 Tax=Glycomyces harbinensis TaxID=58114 RepID=A0A1G6YIV2_9ACTN|nr:hypothetical protein [Glycomyces harbinensis]SDD90434.1 hypothetical protein SAMN05216270_10930 [Glycomyces harbinensis]